MKHRNQAFTLIELLVVICIIAILASMLLPALQSARESASTATCLSNLGQFSKAFQMYATGYNDFMPALTSSQTGSSCSWEYALIDALGQDRNKSPFRNSFFCDADASSETATAGGNKKSYSLNNLQEVIHPRIPNMLGPNGKEGKGDNNKGYISGNKTTAVHTASSLIIIGENVSEGNNIGSAKFSKTDINSPGSASAVHQQVSIIVKRLSSHNTAGELYLDGHAKHMKPQQTLPSKEGLLISKKTSYGDTNPTGCASMGIGDWTDCPKRKVGQDCSDPDTCHKK